MVREPGTRIGLGQSLVRQLPIILQVIVVDALFAPFTPKRQRAFEILSKTRVVMAGELFQAPPAPRGIAAGAGLGPGLGTVA